MQNLKTETEAKSCISPAAETIGSNQDLLTEIFLRIPAKPLLKFECVSKQWLSIISNPKFRSSHARFQKIRNPSPIAVLFKDTYASTAFQHVILKQDTLSTDDALDFNYLSVPRLRIVEFCNGLFLCFINPSKHDDMNSRKYFVCNPTTKQFKIIPPSKHKYRFAHHLAFDPLESPHYMVISLGIESYWPEERYQMGIYTSETESWRLLEISFQMLAEGRPMCYRGDGIYVNGTVHRCIDSDGCSGILCFDVYNETWKLIPMPRDNIDLFHVEYFGESRGHLYLVVVMEEHLSLEVFKMAPDYSGWSLRHHVNLQSLTEAVPELNWNHVLEENTFDVLSVLQTEKKDETLVVILAGDTTFSYNTSDGTANKVGDLQLNPRDKSLGKRNVNAVHQYFESIVSV